MGSVSSPTASPEALGSAGLGARRSPVPTIKLALRRACFGSLDGLSVYLMISRHARKRSLDRLLDVVVRKGRYIQLPCICFQLLERRIYVAGDEGMILRQITLRPRQGRRATLTKRRRTALSRLTAQRRLGYRIISPPTPRKGWILKKGPLTFALSPWHSIRSSLNRLTPWELGCWLPGCWLPGCRLPGCRLP